MFPYLDHDGHLPMYGIMMIIGIIAAFFVLMFMPLHSEIGRWDRIYGASIMLVSGILGAKLFSILTSINIIIEYQLSFIDIIKNGFVFYGGLIGGVVGLLIYCLAYKIPILNFFDLAAVALPLGHAFGRIGCFFAGCCYGQPTDSIFGVTYTSPADPNTPVGIPLLPTQLFETGYLLLIFAALLFLSRKKLSSGILCAVYIFAYSTCRFVNEFFRCDAARGFLWVFSTSQIISILLVLITTAIIIVKIKTPLNKEP